MADTFFVTGGAGFIGSHLTERLLNEGKTVYVVDDLSSGSLDNLANVRHHPNLHLAVDSIMNWPMMNEITEKVDQVIHLAAAVGVRKILDEPVKTITTNVRGCEIVLDCCNRHGKALYIASTSEVYGKAGTNLHEESDRVMGSSTHRRWSYACTKALDEFLALAYHHETGLPVVIGRFFNTVGPRQTGQYGMVVPNFVGQAIRGEPITVFGDGTQSRCFCHVHDAVQAVVGLMEREESRGEIFNIGATTEISILGLAEYIRDRLDSSSPIELIPYETAYGAGFEDMQERQPDTTKIRDFMGWNPTRSLDQIIDDVAANMRGRAGAAD